MHHHEDKGRIMLRNRCPRQRFLRPLSSPTPTHHRRLFLVVLVQAGMRYKGTPSMGDDELQQMRGYEDSDPRVEFMSAFPVSLARNRVPTIESIENINERRAARRARACLCGESQP